MKFSYYKIDVSLNEVLKCYHKIYSNKPLEELANNNSMTTKNYNNWEIHKIEYLKKKLIITTKIIIIVVK